MQATPWLMQALGQVRTLGLAEWCIGAGALRNLVWDVLHGHPGATPPADVDVTFFDPHDDTPERDAALQARLHRLAPATAWDVTNQAGVHHWFERCFGYAVAPLGSLSEAVASWPEFATAVGVALRPDGRLQILAPHGLGDLFAMVVRRNPARVDVATYRARIAGKRYQARWPRVRVLVE